MGLGPLPNGYADRVYWGVLGKVIGVYLGRPFEQWSHERIEAELGEVWWFQNEKLGQPLIVADDDITGAFTFIRAGAGDSVWEAEVEGAPQGCIALLAEEGAAQFRQVQVRPASR